MSAAGRQPSSSELFLTARSRAAGIPAPVRRRIALRHPAWLSVFASLMLCALGVYTMSLTTGYDSAGLGAYGKKQLALLVVALGAALFAAVPHYRLIGRGIPAMIVAVLGALVLLLIPFVPEFLVTPRNGSRRWINLVVMDFQPSELAKVVYVLAIAYYLRYRKNYRTLRGLIPPAVITFVPMGLVLVEPDLGTALLFLPALFAMLIAAGAKLKHLAAVVVVAMVVAPAMYPLLQPHQQARINAVLKQMTGDTAATGDNINYQGLKAQTLIGAGGVAGMGDTKSRAVVHFNRLPEDHNDMIFAVVVNRFGLLGGLVVMGLYLLWLLGATLTAAMCKDPFGRLLVVGLSAMVAAQVIVNIGMNIGVLPITGMTLPFVSYGGASLVVAFLMTGLIVNVAMRRPALLTRQSFEFDDDE
ncbi:MAG: FtsW/RodA/SpoVE family cell cycle protein [Phycisphaeraceae bacterium]|nr:FtsW/RodA/SpoVE family cell cycle protein [Phycisphaeraceae bacterium]